MFDTSFLLFLEHLLLNIFIPFIPWLLFLWIFYGKKFEWIILYFLAWFLWVWVVAFSLLNIQFIHFGIWILEYFVIVLFLLIIFFLKIYLKRQKLKIYIQTLKIKNIIPQIKRSFLKLSVIEKIFTIIIFVYSLYFVSISSLFNFNLPTYVVDSFVNRNNVAYNIYTDWWVKLFGDEDEILWRWRLWYPIHIPVYKALISRFVWWVNDVYLNDWQWLVFFFWLLFIFFITFKKTKNIFLSILPIWLIISLPLIFFHSFDCMDLPLMIYCVVCIWLFFQYLESKDFDYLSLWLLFWFIISYIKNDGFIVYFPWLLFALFVVLCLNKKLIFTVKWFFNNSDDLWKTIWYFMYFFVPFLVVKLVNWLWFNQAGMQKSWVWWSDKIHREIFPEFKQIFWEMDNYNLILIMLWLVIILSFAIKWKNYNDNLFVFAWLFMFLILLAVFLFTVNYEFFLNQYTVNRVFTMCFVMILAFSWFIFHKRY